MTRRLLTVPVTLPARLLDELAAVAKLAGVSKETVIRVALAKLVIQQREGAPK